MTVTLSRISDLPPALRDGQQFARQLDGRQPAVFLDYDGTLTAIVDRPEDAVISDSMRDVVRGLTERTTVYVVSGRDRPAVATASTSAIIGPDPPRCGCWLRVPAVDRHRPVAQRGETRLRRGGGAQVVLGRGALSTRRRLPAALRQSGRGHAAGRLPRPAESHPGKMVYEIQPKVDWDKGKAVQYLRHALHVGIDQFVSLYLGDDITDEDAFRALKGSDRPGIGVVVANPDELEQARRTTATDFVLWSKGEVQQFLNTLAR